MPSFCVVSNCEYKYASSANTCSFHKFPLNSPELLKKWIEFTDRGPDWFPSKWSSICSRHFLPSDFRIQHLRKCLKRTAAPSVTMKSIDFNSIPANDFNESHYKMKRIICRLCARGGAEGQSKSISELNSFLIKCLPPTIRLCNLDNLPDKVCGDCTKKLMQFSLFIDRVASVQKDMFGINAEDTDGVFTFNDCLKESSTKPIIIKQEPIANIKQEIFEFNKSTRNGDEFIPYNASGQDYADAESDAYCEFCDVYFINNGELKNHIVGCHSDNPCNPRERANNCEIMEIITLENAAFIDLDENCVEETPIAPIPQLERVLKVEKTTDIDQREDLIQTISFEHNYASRSTADATENNSIVRNLKQEEMNIQVKSFVQSKHFEQPIVAAIETIEEVTSMEVTQTEIIEPFFDKCTKCNDVFEGLSSLNEHMRAAHVPKTKICPICTAHCRTINHYFIHRSKYHNWSKPRRAKQKLHYKCGDCSKMFLSKFAFDNHNKYLCAKLRFQCSICQLEFSAGMSMLIHKRICKVLMAKLETIDGHTKVNKRLKSHVQRKEVNSSRRHGQQTLARSAKSLRRRRTRDEDYSRITNVPIADPMDISRLDEFSASASDLLPLKSHSLNNGYTCSCGKYFKTLQKFNAHQSAHTSETQPLSCKFCQKTFPLRSYLYQHLVTHDSERKHKCILCTKQFKRMAGLNQHMRGYHYKIKPHVCAVCKHSYALKGDMRRCRHSTLQNKT